MKAFLLAVLACIVIAFGAAWILTGTDPQSSRTAENVRVN